MASAPALSGIIEYEMKLFRPTENTKFQVDYTWFDRAGQDVKVLVRKCLTAEQQEALQDITAEVFYDYVDQETGEVSRVDPVLYTIRSKSLSDPNFITARTPVAEAVFRVFLVNNNQPLSPLELSERIYRKPSEILAQIGGRAVYNGIRPVAES